MSVQSAGTLGAVRDPVGLLVDGSQARRGGGGVLGVTLHPGEQDAAQGGLGGRVQHQLGGKAWKHTSATRYQVKQGWTEARRVMNLISAVHGPQLTFQT